MKMLMTTFSKKFVVFLGVALAFNCSIAQSQQRPASKQVVLQGATVIDGLGGSPVTEAVIVIEGDQIKSLGREGEDYPSEAAVVDVAGKFIIPGLIDSHVHYEEWMGELYLNHGVTAVMAMASGGRVPEGFSKMRVDAQQAGVRTPRMYTSLGPQVNTSMTREQVRRSIQEWLKGNPDFARLPTYNDRSKQVYLWAAEELHRAGLLTFGHAENAPEAIVAGLDIVEHIWGFVQAQMSPQELDEFQTGKYLHWGIFLKDWSRLDRMIRDAVDREAYINPTFLYELGSLSRWAARHELEDYRLYSNPDLMAYYPRNIAESLLQKHRQIRNFSRKYGALVLISRLTPEEVQEFRQSYRLAGEFVKRFVQAGGKIQAGTDASSGGTPGISLHQEMDMLVEAGLTPMQALQSATLWSAEMLAGKGGALGSPKVGLIAEGAFADLVILTANPLDDIANARKIERVMKAGEFIEFGYDPAYFTFTRPPRKIASATPIPGISAITPHTVMEGSSEFEMIVEGSGFMENSVVRVNGVSVSTTFLNPRTLKVRIPANTVAEATPNPFRSPGPAQMTGIYGDRSVPITVYTPPPEGGTSNAILLRVRAKWLGIESVAE